MVEMGRRRPPAPLQVATEIPRHRAVEVLERCVGRLELEGAPCTLANGPHQLVVGTVQWAPGWRHPASRSLATLHGHVVDGERGLRAPMHLDLACDGEGLQVTAHTVRCEATAALRAGVEVLVDELRGWSVAAQGLDD